MFHFRTLFAKYVHRKKQRNPNFEMIGMYFHEFIGCIRPPSIDPRESGPIPTIDVRGGIELPSMGQPIDI